MNSYQDNVAPSWKAFISGKREPNVSRPQIVKSWQRCLRAGVNPYDNRLHEQLDAAALALLRSEKEELIKIAKPFMANLYKFVQGSGFVVVLTDERGYIMEMFADGDTDDNPLTSNFFPGASWREEEAGTNAIGTALKIGEPIQVSGAEHYCQKHHWLTCSAAPIFDNQGNINGVLDMSGVSYMSHLHTLGMVVAAAEAIMAQLNILRKNQELACSNNRLTNIFNTMSEGVLMLDSKGNVSEMNPVAMQIINKPEQEILGHPIEKVFGSKSALTRRMLTTQEPYEDVELLVDTPKNTIHCVVSGKPLTDGCGQITGALIILRPIKQVKNLINQFSGYHATVKFEDIIGESEGILEAVKVATLAAGSLSNVLLQGESGTGKEIFAQAIHNLSEQRNGPFVALNCGVIPRELIGSELFGYVEGAFTGAKRGGKPGKFELASGGTLFLDEIGDMPLEQQVALLRVLQEKTVTRIGGERIIPVNVRIICATHKNLLHEIEKGSFRHDLFYRLNVISITIPPLRDRKEDIPLLFNYFLTTLGQSRKFLVEPGVLDILKNYYWPGNVRELQNVIERAMSLAEDEVIKVEHLPGEIFAPPPLSAPSAPVLPGVLPVEASREKRKQLQGAAERELIVGLLAKHGGNISGVAQELGVARTTLYRKLRTYGLIN